MRVFFYYFMDKYLGKHKVHAVKFSFEYEMETLNLCCLEKRDGFLLSKGKIHRNVFLLSFITIIKQYLSLGSYRH